MTNWLQIGNAVFVLVYLLSAAVQINDPDALAWIALYLSAAIVTGLSLFHQTPRMAAQTLGLIATIWTLLLIPEFYGQVSTHELYESLTMKTQEVEVAREAGGAILVAGWMAVLGFTRHSSDRT